ncbi:hypothetical protein QR680_013277 [Steinernema hermaphroditum]|uniref:Uncharacterized protein n=1 Tax=Steinernema hermaphroditum TaxID=289476 RepID=A0AA39I794_9BILA|nr:hypothetical protein QR680_013277 [Steinernema hermaphroditum]
MKFRISIVTVAGLNAQHDDPVYQEKLLIFKSPELAIFMSPYGSRLLKRSNHIIADGTFKYALAANPFAVVLMTRRTRSDYELMWNTLRESLNAVPGSLQIQYAHFDCESAAVQTFRESFPEVTLHFAHKSIAFGGDHIYLSHHVERTHWLYQSSCVMQSFSAFGTLGIAGTRSICSGFGESYFLPEADRRFIGG